MPLAPAPNGIDAGAGTTPAAPPADLRLLLPALVGWGGVALSLGRGPAVPGSVAAFALVASVLLLAGHRRRRRRRPRRAAAVAPRVQVLALGLLLVTALLTVVAGAEVRSERGPVAELAADRATVRFVGRVLDEPRRLPRTESGPERVAVVVRLSRIEGRGATTPVATPVLVIGDDAWLEVGWRDVVSGTGRLGPTDPGQRARAVLSPRDDPTLIAGPGRLVAAADHAREGMRAAVQPLPADPRGLVPALVIGDRDAIPEDLTEAMRATGMTHLTAVSGTNCSLVVAAAVWLCGMVGLPRRGRPIVAGIVLLGFVVLARPDPSVLRAAVMGAVGLVGLLRSRRAVAMPALGTAIVVLLFVDPWLARSYGFALSVLATLGLLLFARSWADALRRRAPWLGPVAEALTIPLAAQVMCAPVVVLLQGEISVVGVLTNALAAPTVAPATILGFGVALVGVLSPAAATVLAWAAALPAWGIALIARVGARAPMRAVPWPDDAWGALLLAGLTALVLLCGAGAWRWVGRRRRPVLLAIALVAALVLPHLWVRSHTGFPGPGAGLVMCDIGQGDAFLLISGPGRAVLVDTGPDPDALDRCLDEVGIEVIDAVVLTHFDTDHVGGLEGVDRGRVVGDVVVSSASLHDIRPAVERWWGRHGRPVHALSQGDRVIWGAVSAVVRGPKPGPGPASSPNAGSLVLDAVIDGEASGHDDLRVLLLADVDEEAGRVVRTDLRSHPSPPLPHGTGADPSTGQAPVDVVKVAHHGSADHDATLLRQVAAPVALISVGEDNRYGHPAPSLLEDVRSAGSVVYRTDTDGAVAVRKEHGQLVVTRERP